MSSLSNYSHVKQQLLMDGISQTGRGQLVQMHIPLKSHGNKINNTRKYKKEIGTILVPGRVAQSVTCLATDASLTADPGVASSIPARSHTFVEIDHEISSKVILLPSAESFKKGCCQLQAKVCARSTG